MAITQGNLVNSSAASGTSATTASFTPGSNQLVIAAIANKRSAGTPTIPTVTGNSLTYVQVATVTYNTIASPLRRITLFRAMGGSPSAGAATIDFGGTNQDGIYWNIIQFNGVNTGGTNGSAAVVQSSTTNSDSSTNLTITLSALADATNNATYGIFGNNGNTWTTGAGYTTIVNNESDNAIQAQIEWKLPGSTTVNATCAASNCAAIAIEIGAAPTNWGKMLGQELNRLVVP